ncbi:MAG: polysaccharide biosynthesis/export family protein [Azoarcus sp.]|jgi:polysaccharide export outer membrane protein|nr:polysaccharide biosynthesis/export family protein [Azoarcus sp.]
MNTRTLPFLLLLAALTACTTPQSNKMTVASTNGATGANSVNLQVKQVLRPLDVLDVIFHLEAASKDAYRIQPGDEVQIDFLTAIELNTNRQVLPDGTIQMPYVPAIKVGGLTVEEARKQVIAKYGPVLKYPEVTFSVRKPLAQVDNLRESLSHPSTGLSREITIGTDGRASFPLIGVVPMQGMSVDEAEAKLNQIYTAKSGQVRVDLLLKSTVADSVYVLGEVNQPGAYPIRRPVSVLEALSLARGTQVNARLDSVVVMHRQGDQVEARVYDVHDMLNGNASQIAYLQPDDLVFVPKTRLARASEVTRQLYDIINFRGVSVGFTYRIDEEEYNR